MITDDHLCETIRRYARETIIGSKSAKNKPTYYGQAEECDKSINKFWDYLSEIEKTMSARGTSDEEGED